MIFAIIAMKRLYFRQMGTVETFIEISSFITDAINHFGSVK